MKKNILHTPFLDVYLSSYTNNKTQSHPLYSIEMHPRSVIIVPRNEKNEFYITKEVRPILGTWLYSLPGGFVEEGETYEEAAVRELHEETGLTSHHVTIRTEIFPLPGLVNQRTAVVVAEGPFQHDKPHQEPFESIEGSWMSLPEVLVHLQESGKWDAQALAALFIFMVEGTSAKIAK